MTPPSLSGECSPIPVCTLPPNPAEILFRRLIVTYANCVEAVMTRGAHARRHEPQIKTRT